MIKREKSIRRRLLLTSALALISITILTSCTSSSMDQDPTDGPIGTPPFETHAAVDMKETEAEAPDSFFSIMQKFSAGEIEAVSLDQFNTLEGKYGIVFLAEESESGLKLYGYVSPTEQPYTGAYAITAGNNINAFPDLIYTDDSLTPPTLQWEAQEKKLTISSVADEEASGAHHFKLLDNGLLVSLDDEPEEESTEAETSLAADLTQEQANAGVAAFLELLKAGDKEAIAEMILFPATVTVPSGAHDVNNAEEFLPYYDELFTEEFADRLLKADHEAFVHNGMVSFDAGQIWFIGDSESGSLEITAINGDNESSLR